MLLWWLLRPQWHTGRLMLLLLLLLSVLLVWLVLLVWSLLVLLLRLLLLLLWLALRLLAAAPQQLLRVGGGIHTPSTHTDCCMQQLPPKSAQLTRQLLVTGPAVSPEHGVKLLGRSPSALKVRSSIPAPSLRQKICRSC